MQKIGDVIYGWPHYVCCKHASCGRKLVCRRGHYWTPILRCRAINYINNRVLHIHSTLWADYVALSLSLDRIMQMTSFKPCLYVWLLVTMLLHWSQILVEFATICTYCTFFLYVHHCLDRIMQIQAMSLYLTACYNTITLEPNSSGIRQNLHLLYCHNFRSYFHPQFYDTFCD